jgi:hypothetical protein
MEGVYSTVHDHANAEMADFGESGDEGPGEGMKGVG